ncbi:hypothetical protein FG05_35105 [Fusarium graminearum]|nr:hypothetical protein FG05_35105 [Fusarium graminearum]
MPLEFERLPPSPVSKTRQSLEDYSKANQPIYTAPSVSSTTLGDRAQTQKYENAVDESEYGTEIHQLARRFTTGSAASGHRLPFPLSNNGLLDPSSSCINSEKWTEAYFKRKTAAANSSTS